MDDNSFEFGPVLDEGVIPWLGRHAADRKLRLPIEIHGTSLSLESSFLMTKPVFSQIWLDTGALSIDLPMHLRRHCRSYPCRMWLEGTWGPLAPGGIWRDRPVFAVSKVVGAVETEPTNALLLR